jgi:hypothetical protein
MGLGESLDLGLELPAEAVQLGSDRVHLLLEIRVWGCEELRRHEVGGGLLNLPEYRRPLPDESSNVLLDVRSVRPAEGVSFQRGEGLRRLGYGAGSVVEEGGELRYRLNPWNQPLRREPPPAASQRGRLRAGTVVAEGEVEFDTPVVDDREGYLEEKRAIADSYRIAHAYRGLFVLSVAQSRLTLRKIFVNVGVHPVAGCENRVSRSRDIRRHPCCFGGVSRVFAVRRDEVVGGAGGGVRGARRSGRGDLSDHFLCRLGDRLPVEAFLPLFR